MGLKVSWMPIICQMLHGTGNDPYVFYFYGKYILVLQGAGLLAPHSFKTSCHLTHQQQLLQQSKIASSMEGKKLKKLQAPRYFRNLKG
jgi:hypothetical protein